MVLSGSFLFFRSSLSISSFLLSSLSLSLYVSSFLLSFSLAFPLLFEGLSLRKTHFDIVEKSLGVKSDRTEKTRKTHFDIVEKSLGVKSDRTEKTRGWSGTREEKVL